GEGQQSVPQRSIRFTTPAPTRPAMPPAAPASGPAVESVPATPAPAAELTGVPRGGSVPSADGGRVAQQAAKEPAHPTAAPIYLGSQTEDTVAQNTPASDRFFLTSRSSSPAMDLFGRPVVEPYAVSEPLSTAGKVDLESRIAGFEYQRYPELPQDASGIRGSSPRYPVIDPRAKAPSVAGGVDPGIVDGFSSL